MRTKKNSFIKLLGSTLAIVSIIFSSYIPLVSQTSAGPTTKQVALYDAIRGGFSSNGNCTNSLLGSYITKEEYSQSDYYGLPTTGSINTSSLTDDSLGDGKDGKVSCTTIVKRYVEAKYGTGEAGRQAFIKAYYDTTLIDNNYYSKTCVTAAKTNDPSGWKEDLSSLCVSTFGDQASDQLKKEMTDYGSTIKQGNEDWLTNYAKGVLVEKFNACWRFESFDPASEPDRTSNNEYQEKNWKRKDGSDGTHNVGYLVETSFAGGYGDGKLTCDEIRDAVLSEKLLDYSDTDTASQLTEEERVNNVMGVFLGQDINKFILCRATLPSAFDSIEATELMRKVAKWLIDPEANPLTLQIAAGETRALTSEEATAFTDCLNSQYGDALTEAAAKDITAPSTGTNSDNSANPPDPCLSSDDFLGWFACPLINMIVKSTEKIEDIIKDALKFDLSNIGTDAGVNSAMKDSWSIFRSIATILLVIGFLVALLVKAIKG